MNEHDERGNYRHGYPLAAESLSKDQEFHIKQRELWNKVLSGWGIIGDGFELHYYASVDCISVSPGYAIAQDGQALYSLEDLTADDLQPSPKDRFALVCIERRTDACGEALSVDGETPIFTALQDRTVLGKVVYLTSEEEIPDMIRRMSANGQIIVGSLEKSGDVWAATKKHRQQGPIDPAGGKDAARIAAAIAYTGARASADSRSMRRRLTWLVCSVAILLAVVGGAWIGVWCWRYFVPLAEPYRLVALNNLSGPVQGKTYLNSDSSETSPYLAVRVEDRAGNPVPGIDIAFRLTSPPPEPSKEAPSPLEEFGKVVSKPEGAVFVRSAMPDERTLVELPQYVVVKTNEQGLAFPSGIRFDAADKQVRIDVGAVRHEHLRLPPLVRNASTNQLTTIAFVGHFAHRSGDMPNDLNTTPSELPVTIRERIVPQAGAVTLVAQTLSGKEPTERPVCLEWNALDPQELQWELWKFTDASQGKYKIDGKLYKLDAVGRSGTSDNKLGVSIAYQDTLLIAKLPWPHGAGRFLVRFKVKLAEPDPSYWDLVFETRIP